MKRAAAIFLVTAGILTQPPQAIAEPPQGVDLNSTISKWYHSLFDKAGRQCCGPADCRGAAVRPLGPGWEAFVDKPTFGPTAPDDWVRVPEQSMIYREDNPTGRNVICWFQNEVRCATLSPGG